MARKAIDKEQVAAIVARRKAGTAASAIPGELGLSSSTVNVVLSAKG